MSLYPKEGNTNWEPKPIPPPEIFIPPPETPPKPKEESK